MKKSIFAQRGVLYEEGCVGFIALALLVLGIKGICNFIPENWFEFLTMLGALGIACGTVGSSQKGWVSERALWVRLVISVPTCLLAAFLTYSCISHMGAERNAGGWAIFGGIVSTILVILVFVVLANVICEKHYGLEPHVPLCLFGVIPAVLVLSIVWTVNFSKERRAVRAVRTDSRHEQAFGEYAKYRGIIRKDGHPLGHFPLELYEQEVAAIEAGRKQRFPADDAPEIKKTMESLSSWFSSDKAAEPKSLSMTGPVQHALLLSNTDYSDRCAGVRAKTKTAQTAYLDHKPHQARRISLQHALWWNNCLADRRWQAVRRALDFLDDK